MEHKRKKCSYCYYGDVKKKIKKEILFIEKCETCGHVEKEENQNRKINKPKNLTNQIKKKEYKIKSHYIRMKDNLEDLVEETTAIANEMETNENEIITISYLEIGSVIMYRLKTKNRSNN